VVVVVMVVTVAAAGSRDRGPRSKRCPGGGLKGVSGGHSRGTRDLVHYTARCLATAPDDGVC